MLELELLLSKEAGLILQQHADDDPASFALKFRHSDLPTPILAKQISLRKKALAKLPTWVEKNCLFTSRAYEQCSSEATLRLKDVGRGNLAFDLTGGLGVDSWKLARHFSEVHYVDPNPLLCRLAEVNFSRLGQDNIHIHNTTAEQFLEQWKGPNSDLIYLDPDRRNAKGERRYALADCQPNAVSLMPQILGLSSRAIVKASPMLDMDEGARQLVHCHEAMAIAVENEVREVLFVCQQNLTPSPLKKTILFLRKDKSYRYSSRSPEGYPPPIWPESAENLFIYEADVALYKARLTWPWFQEASELKGGMNHQEGYFFSEQSVLPFPGRAYQAIAWSPFKPKQVKRLLKSMGIDKANLSRRFFDLPLEKVRTQLGLKEGGEHHLLLTKSPKGERFVFVTKRIN